MKAAQPIVRLVDEDFLTKEERTSPVWLSIKAKLQAKLEELRIKNDDAKLTDVETATLRGHLRMLKAFLALGNEPPVRVATAARPTARPDYGAKYG